MIFRAASAAILAAFSAAAVAQVRSPASDAGLQAILNDAVSRRLLAPAEHYEVVPLTVYSGLPEVESPNRVAALSDKPASGKLLDWPVSASVENIFAYRSIPGPPVRPRLARQELLYARVLRRRTPVFLRRLGISWSAEKPSPFIAQYRELERSWLAAHLKVERLTASSAPAKKIARAKHARAAALRRWNRPGSRRQIRLMLMRQAFAQALDPAITWDLLEYEYIEGGGAHIQVYGGPPTGDVAVALATAADSAEGWQTIEPSPSASSVSYKLLLIRRTWLDERILNFYAWEWSKSAPFEADTRLGSSTECKAVSQLSCINEYVVVVREPGRSSAAVPVAFIARRLPKVPEPGATDEANETDQNWRPRLDRIIDRLRDGSF